MSTLTIPNEIRKYLDGLSATHPVCAAYTTTLISGDNLYMYSEPAEASRCITIIPYGGAPPREDGIKHEASVQIRLKINSRSTGVKTMQAIINDLDHNDEVCASVNGIVLANQSQPLIINTIEGGETLIIVANFTVKYARL